MMQRVKRIAVMIIGMTVLLIGVALLVLPGPAFVVIPIGLAILATEYAWARRALKRVTDTTEKAAAKLNLRSMFPRRQEESSGGPDKQ
ncbi:MAG: Integral rane protein TerC [Acidobacteria bacterium]|jgi:tellurite resistance protein TerC|nr:Integral rane protein TerC [Acidobacteriota bacterium]